MRSTREDGQEYCQRNYSNGRDSMFVFQVEGQKQSRTFMSKNKYQRTFAQ